MLLTLLNHEIKSKLRARLLQKGIAVTIILGLFAVYFLLVAIGLGLILPKLFEESAPNLTPLEAMNQVLAYYLISDIAIRFMLQSYPLMSIQPYLLMPISRNKLYHFLMVRSIPDFFNLFPYFIVIPFLFTGIIPNEGAAAAGIWLVFVSCMIFFNHYLGFYLKRSFNIKPLLTIGLLVGLAALYYVDQQGWLPLSSSFGKMVDVLITQPLWLSIPIAALSGIYVFMVNRLKKYAYLDAMDGNRKKEVSTQNFEILNRFGRIGEMIQLDLKLIWRNKRPRTMTVMAVFFIIYPLIFDDNLTQYTWFVIFVGFFVTGMAMTNYGQFMLSWESSFFDLLMSRKWSIHDYYEAKFYLFAVTSVAFLLISSFYYFIDPKFPLVFFAVGIYNIGINSFLLMFFSTYNTKRIDLGKQAFFNYEGVGASQFVMVLPVMVLPILVYLPFGIWGQPNWGIIAIAGLGVIGILLRQYLINLVVKQFEKRKYKIITGFRER